MTSAPEGHRLLCDNQASLRFSAKPAWIIALLILGYSGYIKGSPFVDWLAVDLTLLSALVVLIAGFGLIVSGRTLVRGSSAVIALWCAWLPGAAIAVATELDLYKSILLFTVTLLCAFSPFYLIGDARTENYWINGQVAFSLIFAVALIVFPEDTDAAGYLDRLSLEGGNSIGAARLVGAGVLVAFIRALTDTKGRRRAIWWLLVVVGSVLVATIGSRGPFVSLIFAGFGSTLLSIVFAGRRLRVAVVTAIAVIGLLYYAYTSLPDDRISRLFTQVVDVPRQGLYQSALRSIEQEPIGIGWGGFRNLPNVSDTFGSAGAYPHNIFLETFAEGGVVAIAGLILFIGISLKRIRRISDDAAGAIIFSLGIYWLLAAQTSSDINSNRMTWIALAVGLAVWGNRRAAPDIPRLG